MVLNILIVANGSIENYSFYKNLIKKSDIIICADGGANTAVKLDIIPDYIIGDLDSIKHDVLEYYKEKSEIIKDVNQNKTDFELALELAESKNPKNITIIGAIGKRIDHTFANILSLIKIKKGIKAKIVDHHNTIELVDNNTEVIGKKNEIVSIIPLTNLKNLNYSGFKWDVKNLNTDFGWFGISNKLEGEKGIINLDKGKFLLVRVRKK